MPDHPAFLEADIPVWDPPVYDAIALAHHEGSNGTLIVYDPDVAKGRACIQSDYYIDTYDAR